MTQSGCQWLWRIRSYICHPATGSASIHLDSSVWPQETNRFLVCRYALRRRGQSLAERGRCWHCDCGRDRECECLFDRPRRGPWVSVSAFSTDQGDACALMGLAKTDSKTYYSPSATLTASSSRCITIIIIMFIINGAYYLFVVVLAADSFWLIYLWLKNFAV